LISLALTGWAGLVFIGVKILGYIPRLHPENFSELMATVVVGAIGLGFVSIGGLLVYDTWQLSNGKKGIFLN
jgi:hypothetical protein